MSVKNGLYDLGGFGTDGIKKNIVFLSDYPDYSWDDSHIQAPRVRREIDSPDAGGGSGSGNRFPSLSRGIKDFMLESFEPSSL